MNASNRSSWNRRVGIALLTGALMFFGTSNVWSERNQNPGVLPPGSTPYGMTYPQWAADWSQWIYSIPADQNPLLHPDDQFCNVGQSPPVFLLASNAGGTTETHCTIPTGQAVLFSPGGIMCIGFDGETDNELRACVEDNLALITNVTADVDGRPIRDMEKYLFISKPYILTVPPGSIFGADVPPGPYKAVTGGYFLVHTPLPPGRHVIHFHDELPAFDNFVSDVTYVITVGSHH